jgi:hypothetical protein
VQGESLSSLGRKHGLVIYNRASARDQCFKSQPTSVEPSEFVFCLGQGGFNDRPGVLKKAGKLDASLFGRHGNLGFSDKV